MKTLKYSGRPSNRLQSPEIKPAGSPGPLPTFLYKTEIKQSFLSKYKLQKYTKLGKCTTHMQLCLCTVVGKRCKYQCSGQSIMNNVIFLHSSYCKSAQSGLESYFQCIIFTAGFCLYTVAFPVHYCKVICQVIQQ